MAASADIPFSGVVASVTSSQPDAPLSAVIDWGDGQTSDGIIRADGRGGFVVSGDHTWGAPGQYDIATSIYTELAVHTTVSSTATVGATFVVLLP